MQFSIIGYTELLRIIGNAVYADVYFRIQFGLTFRQVEGDDIRQGIVIQECNIFLQQTFVCAENVVDIYFFYFQVLIYDLADISIKDSLS
ncbi:hypothetical protein D9M68_658680 [compost metagenome]